MGFSVSNGQIIGPNGQPFIAGGVDIWAGQVINDPTGSANLIASLFPNANMVRIAAGDGYAADSAAALTPFVNLMTSKGIVVEIGNYNPALTSNVASGQALTDELAWFTNLATAFKGNPYVWFSTDNEPSDQYTYGGATSAEQLAVYNAIRATGSTSMIGLENSQWSMNGQQSFSASISASDIAGMTNVHWDDHYYNWLSNYSTSVSDNLSALQAEVAGSQVYKDANGVIPVIVGESGNSTTGTGIDGGGTATIAAVLESGYGSTAWGINPGGTGDQLTNGNSLTAFGLQVAAAETVSPTLQSVSGTKITAASGNPIIDAAGRSWTLVQSASQGLQTAINGTVDTSTANVVLLETLHGNMVQENSAGSWYSEPGTGGAWAQIVAPPATSPSGTEITTAAANPIIDQSGNAWTLVQSATNGLQIAVNGMVDAPTANVVLLETLSGAMVQENAAGNWYSETTPNDSWTQIANPNPPPVVSAITTSPASGDLTVGATVNLTVTFSSTVTVAGGTPGLALNDGGAATYVSGSGSNALVFKYTVATAQNTADLAPAASSAITLNGATIHDASGNNAVLTGANGYNPAGTLQIDTTAPKLSAIATSPGSGQVATGGTVTLTVTFSEAVIVADGTPTLALNDGGTATYLSGSGSSALTFKYTVAAGQSTTALKLAATNAVALNGGTIRDTAGNNAVLTGANGYIPAGTLVINPLPPTNDFLITPGSGTFKDAAGNTYVVDSSNNANENGQPIPGGGGTSAMAYFNGTVYGQDAGSGQWYTWNQAGWTPAASNMLDVTTVGTLTTTLSQTGTFAENGDNFVLSSGNVVKATLGSGNDNVGFIGPQQVVLTGGSGAATVLAAGGNNTFTAGLGSLDVTAGAGKDAYVFHTTSGLLTLEDFSLAKGDTLTIDKSLQGSLHEASDAKGGTMLTFGTNTSHGVDIHGLAALPSSNIVWA